GSDRQRTPADTAQGRTGPVMDPATALHHHCVLPLPPPEALMSLKAKPVSVFGVPTDVGAGSRGASMGPEALRVANLVEALRARGVDVVDRGDVSGPRNPWQPPVDGYRHLDEVVAW